jgi:hypothetical protein
MVVIVMMMVIMGYECIWRTVRWINGKRQGEKKAY